ncbi:MAG: 4-oxalocrotonate tautomerase family protein [SAR202 cluster bacterium]|nr:4-oxalocrotonate tautomerase family protein [SAR202 cluster bacterium]|tara:strand:+ start:332 stop:520 length:189 start_codon:yes stop_codon:yes gene_type:complete
MPVVNVAMYAGRTDQQKADLAKAITEAISKTAGIPDSATTIIFQDVQKTEWAVGGVMASEDQ